MWWSAETKRAAGSLRSDRPGVSSPARGRRPNALESRGLLRPASCFAPLGKELMRFVSDRSSPAILLGVAVAAVAAFAALPVRAGAATIKSTDIIELNQAVRDSETAKPALVRIRRFLAEKPDSVYNVFLRQLLLTALITTNSPGAQVAGAADTVLMLPLRDA